MLDCDPLLAAIIADGSVRLYRADIYDVELPGGETFYWSGYDRDLTWNGNTYSVVTGTLTRSKLGMTNTMVLPEMEIYLDASPSEAFNGGLDLVSQLHNRLLDGAIITLHRLYMQEGTDTSLGVITKFRGKVGDVHPGLRSTIQVLAFPELAQDAPRRIFQINCSNIFCDQNCTLSAADFTSMFTVDLGPTKTSVPWTAAPGTPPLFAQGTLTMTSGDADGQIAAIDNADSSGVTLAYPLYNAPAPGDTFTAFQGCNRLHSTCTLRGNADNYAGFRFIPPATVAV